MTKSSQHQGKEKGVRMRTHEVNRFFDVWRGEPEQVRTFIRNLARKLDEIESVVAETAVLNEEHQYEHTSNND
ncbi:MAG: hypothetical protein HY403_00195 [Elusimicrobia bacterium]|nr:hypothetical protein [Elusimicrobiota bacterium]